MLSSISMSDFIKNNINYNIIDMRSVESFNNNHIPGARNIQMEKLIATPYKYLDRYVNYYIYCQKGIKSIKLVQILQRMGYRATSIDGGYESWILEKKD